MDEATGEVTGEITGEVTTAPPLELSYRRVLRLLPGEYRERWADDMVATLLETEQQAAADAVSAEGAQRQAEEREIALLGRPPVREVAAVALLALRLHLAAPTTPGASETGRRWGEAVRRLALVLLALDAGTSAVVVQSALFPRLPADLVGAVSQAELLLSAVPALLAVLAFLSLVGGRVGVAVACAVLASASSLWWQLVDLSWAGRYGPATAVASLASTVLTALPLLALVAWRAEAPRPDRRWLWAPLAVAAVQVALVLPVVLRPERWEAFAANGGLWLLGDAAGATCFAALVVASVAAVRRAPSWWRTALLLALAGGLGRVAFLVQLPGWSSQQQPTVLVVGGAQLVVAAAVAVAAVVVLRRPRPRP